MSLMEKRKYLEPKFSSTTVKLLEHYGINIDLPVIYIYIYIINIREEQYTKI